MYMDYPGLDKPKKETASLWRYMDFAQFVCMLERRQLFFARADKLGDPFEGSIPKTNLNRRPEFMRTLGLEDTAQTAYNYASFRKIQREFTVVNCWHQSIYESAAMWRMHLKSDEGIAIRSTFERLKNSINPRKDFCLGKVKYIDFDKDEMREDGVFPLYTKMKSFRHEREVRALIQEMPLSTSAWIRSMESKKKRPFEDGLYVDVDLEKLVKRVYVAPRTADWFYELVKSVLEKYRLKKRVQRSRLDETPIF